MRKIIFFQIILIKILSGCAWLLKDSSSYEAEPYQDKMGIYRVREFSSETSFQSLDRAIRRENGELISLSSEASQRAGELMRDSSLLTPFQCAPRGFYESGYESSIRYYEAVSEVRKKNCDHALEKFKEAKEYCDALKYNSTYLYLKAYCHFKVKDKEKAKIALKDFLKFSERVEPISFNQLIDGEMGRDSQKNSDYNRLSIETLSSYRKQALNFLDGKSTEISVAGIDLKERVAKLPPNNPFRPGGSRLRYIAVLPRYSSGTRVNSFDRGSVLGMSLSFPAYGFNIAPGFSSHEYLGATYNLFVRHPFWESESRDLNLEWLSYIGTAKKGFYTLDQNGKTIGAKVADSGVEYGLGFGATKRLNSRLGISSQVNVFRSFVRDEYQARGTLFGFYSFYENWSVFGGYIRDEPLIGVEWLWVRIGYNFKEEGVDLSFLNVYF